jgi:AcrR family transcriptional regulator
VEEQIIVNKQLASSPKSPKPQAKTEEKKRQILVVALQCFTEHGVEGTTIDMIREASGMSVGSLYHHFGNKDKIAAAVFIQGMREFADLLRSYLADAKENLDHDAERKVEHDAERKVEHGVKAIVYANVDWISQNPDWARFVFHHRSIVSKAGAGGKLANDMQSFYQQLIAWFMPYAKQGALRPVSIELLSSLITGPCHDYARHWLGGRYKAPLAKQREELANAAWNAVKA